MYCISDRKSIYCLFCNRYSCCTKGIQWNLCNPTTEFSDILWHPTDIYGPKVFLLTKLKPEYSDILYNPTHFPGPLVCRIRQFPLYQYIDIIIFFALFVHYANNSHLIHVEWIVRNRNIIEREQPKNNWNDASFFFFLKCDIFIEICTFVSWIHKVPVPYPDLVNISKAHNI